MIRCFGPNRGWNGGFLFRRFAAPMLGNPGLRGGLRKIFPRGAPWSRFFGPDQASGTSSAHLQFTLQSTLKVHPQRSPFRSLLQREKRGTHGIRNALRVEVSAALITSPHEENNP